MIQLYQPVGPTFLMEFSKDSYTEGPYVLRMTNQLSGQTLIDPNVEDIGNGFMYRFIVHSNIPTPLQLGYWDLTLMEAEDWIPGENENIILEDLVYVSNIDEEIEIKKETFYYTPEDETDFYYDA